jgi:hypothetical protein
MWEPVLARSYDAWLGVLYDGTLGVGKFDEGRVSLEASNFVVAWPFLEREFDDFYEQLRGCWHQLAGGDVETPQRFVERLLTSAWTSGRPYWMRLCLPWALRTAQLTEFDAGVLRTVLASMAGSEVIPEDGRESARRALAGFGLRPSCHQRP